MADLDVDDLELGPQDPHIARRDTGAVPAELPMIPTSYGKQLYRRAVDFANENHYFGQFAHLHVANILHLQNQLAKLQSKYAANEEIISDDIHKEEILDGDPETATLRRTLGHYTRAIRDFEYILKLNSPQEDRDDKRGSLISSFQGTVPQDGHPSHYVSFSDTYTEQEPDPVRDLLKNTLPRHLAWSQKERRDNQDGYWGNEKPKSYSRWVDTIARFLIAFSGAAALIVPIIIMTVPDTSKWKVLGTLIGSTLLFGWTLAGTLRSTLEDQDILAATAAYAAVLVVFYGNVTNISGGVSSGSGANSTA